MTRSCHIVARRVTFRVGYLAVLVGRCLLVGAEKQYGRDAASAATPIFVAKLATAVSPTDARSHRGDWATTVGKDDFSRAAV